MNREDVSFSFFLTAIVGSFGGFLWFAATPIYLIDWNIAYYIIVFDVVLSIIVGEIFFWKFNGEKPKKNQSKFWFTVEMKSIDLATALIVVSGNFVWFYGAYGIINKIGIETVINFFGYGTLIILSIYAFFKLNSLKYRNVKYKETKKAKKK